MGRCIFKTKDVKRCIKHALKSTDFRMAFSTEPPQPALLFVHDEGVYLMSNGLPADQPAGAKRSYVAYAEGCNPDIDADCWETSRALVGGDDFGEVIILTPNVVESCDNYKELHVETTENEINVYAVAPTKKKTHA